MAKPIFRASIGKVYILFLLLSGAALADQVNCVKWKNLDATTAATYCKPFSVRAGSGVTFSNNDLDRVLTISSTGAVAGAGGSNTQLQFNLNGSLSGSSGLTWNDSTKTLTSTHITGLDNRPYIDVQRDCGLKGSGLSSDGAAEDAALATCMATYYGARFYFPQTSFTNPAGCSYYFASSITPPVGSGGAVFSGGSNSLLNNVSHLAGTVLCFPAGVTGFNLQNCGCTIEYISLLGSEPINNLQAPTLFNIGSDASLPLYTRNITTIQRASNVLTILTARVVGIEGLTQQVGSAVKISGVVGDATMNGECVVTSLAAGGGSTATNPTQLTCYQNGADSGPFGAVGTVSLATTGTSTADGIRVCNNFTFINHVSIQSFGRHGINADSLSGHGCTVPFSDDLVLRDSQIVGNQANGYLCYGVDCNAHLLSGNAFYYNALWGIEDQSSLGNTHIGNQISNNSHFWAGTATPATKAISTISRTLSGNDSTVSVVLSVAADSNQKVGSCVVIAGVSDTSFNTATPPAGTATQCFFVVTQTDNKHFTYIQPGAPADASSSGGTSRMAKFSEGYISAGVDDGAQKIATQSAVASATIINQYVEGGQYCKWGPTSLTVGGANTPDCAQTIDWMGQYQNTIGCSGFGGILCSTLGAIVQPLETGGNVRLKAGTNQTFGFSFLNSANATAWATFASPSGTLGGSGYFQVTSQGFGQTRLIFWGKDVHSGNTYINAEGSGGKVIFGINNAGTNSGTGGIEIDSGGSSPAKVASIDGTGLVTVGSTLVGSLPSAASNPGAMIRVSDSTTISAEGQTCVGSSSNNALAFSNGSVWKCF